MGNLVYFIMIILGIMLVIVILRHLAGSKLIPTEKSKKSKVTSHAVESAVFNEIMGNINDFKKAEDENKYAPIRKLVNEIEKNAQLIVNAIISDAIVLSKKGRFPNYRAHPDGTLKCEYGYHTAIDQKLEFTDSALVKFNKAHENLIVKAISHYQSNHPCYNHIFDSVNEILNQDGFKFVKSRIPIEYNVFDVEPVT